MDPQPDQVGPSKNHQLFCNPQQPHFTLVMLKNIEHMGYFHCDSLDHNGKFKQFPNYFILNNITTAHKQKATLQAMLNQKTYPPIMIEQFCELARACYPDEQDIQKLKGDFLKDSISTSETLKWYTKTSFFYQLLNRLLRAGKDSTELYYGQHFTKLLTQAIQKLYQKQKSLKKEQVADTFNCYRGAYFSHQQIKELQNNIGKHIQTLGFMSTSTNKKMAYNFIGNGNTFVEIEVSSDAPKDGELDLGYAYLGKEYSEYGNEEQVLFNVLSSFRIKSVGKLEDQEFFQYQEREVWHIKLQYGVAYQMMQNYKQNKLQKNTAEQQLVLAILSHQNLFKVYDSQELCLQQENAIDGYIWMKKTKISLCKNIPYLQQIGQSQQIGLYHKLTTVDVFRGRQQKLVQSIEPKYFSSICQQNNNPSAIQMAQNMDSILRLIQNYYHNKFFEEAESLIKKWREKKKKLVSNSEFQYQAQHINPQVIEKMEQQQTTVSAYEIMTNIKLSDKNGDMQKLEQQIYSAQQLQQQLLTKYGRYHHLYIALSGCFLNSAYKNGLITVQPLLQFQQQVSTMANGAKVDQKYTFLAKLVSMGRQASRHIQHKQWAEAVKLCTEFRDEHYKGREHKDKECFGPIYVQLNKENNNWLKKLQILQACLNVKHPKDSAFSKFAQEKWQLCKQQKQQRQKQQRLMLSGVIEWPASEQLIELFRLKQKGLQLFSPKDSLSLMTTQYLIVNALRMAGKDQDAFQYLKKMQQQYSATKYRQFFSQLMQLFDK